MRMALQEEALFSCRRYGLIKVIQGCIPLLENVSRGRHDYDTKGCGSNAKGKIAIILGSDVRST